MITLRMYNRAVEGALELKWVLNGGERVGRVGYLFCELDVFRAIWVQRASWLIITTKISVNGS